MPRPRPQLVALAAVLLVIAGCQSDDNSRDTPATSASPTCNHAPDTGGGDMGLGAGFDYAEKSHHDFDTAAPITLCMNVPNGVVRMTGSTPKITVEPETLPGPGTRFTFAVTVARGATGRMEVQLMDDVEDVEAAGIRFHGPEIETDDTGWSFAPWGTDG